MWQRNYCSKPSAGRDGDVDLDPVANGARSLEQQLSYNKEGKCVNAYKILSSLNMLVGRYSVNDIKSNPGNMTKGAPKETLDGISLGYFEKLNETLIDESWKPKPSHIVYINKANGKKRPLGIPCPRDKVVQEGMRAILEIVLEPKFLDCSHGFRPNRGCHTALSKIRY